MKKDDQNDNTEEIFYQIDNSKIIVQGEEPIGPKPTRIKDIIFKALNNSYRFSWIQNKSQPYHGIFFDGIKDIDLYIYAWRISNGGKGRNMPYEKRIQINKDVNNIGFKRPITRKEKTILIGIYENSPLVPILSAWDAAANREHTQKSCQVDIKDLKEALDEGIFETKDSHENTIYTFTEDYLGQYIELIKDDGKVNIDSTVTKSESLKSKIKKSTLSGKKQTEVISIAELIDKASALTETEKKSIIKARVGQGLFKKILIEKYNGKCCICGLSCKQLLIGSHIKDWSESEDHERLDSNNGLLLCSKHDALFDKYLISFDDEGKIIISTQLTDEDKKILDLSDEKKIDVTNEMKPYLEWHRKKLI